LREDVGQRGVSGKKMFEREVRATKYREKNNRGYELRTQRYFRFIFSVLGNKNTPTTMSNSIMSAAKQVNKVKPINRPADKGSPNQNYNR